MKISTILDQIDSGDIALPVFQRGYVWNRDQVRGLMKSLYKGYPIGSLIVWTTPTQGAKTRGYGQLADGSVDLLLDGQQRITSLYGLVRGKPPTFFDGNKDAFSGLFFNLEDEAFEFYAPLKMKGQAKWIDVTAVMQQGLGPFLAQIMAHYGQDPALPHYLTRLNSLASIKDILLHLEKVTGQDKTLDIVVEIFNEVNKGGTTLSKGDLALAKICATWPPARDEMKRLLNGWSKNGYHFTLDWLLRNVNAVIKGEAMFNKLEDVDALAFQQGLIDTEKAVNALLNIMAGRLGLDHDRVLGGRYAFPVLSRFLHQQGNQFPDAQTQDRLLYWYVQSFLWGRFSGSTETVLNQDLNAMELPGDPLDHLIAQLVKWRGDLTVRPADFSGHSLRARFYPLMYLLTRVGDARDWGNGLPLKSGLLGKGCALQVHHIFPKALLYKHGYGQSEVNAIANFCFLTQTTNLQISDQKPDVYFAQIEKNHPGALASQWVPLDQDLWLVENYHDFLKARRDLLAEAANNLLDGLRHIIPSASVGAGIAVAAADPMLAANQVQAPQAVASVTDSDEAELSAFIAWIESHSLPRPEEPFDLPTSDPNATPATADLAWPDGIQTGLSKPVALVREDAEATQAFLSAGYQVFEDIAALRQSISTLISVGSA